MITGLRLASSSDVPAIQRLEVSAGQMFRTVGLAVIAKDPPPDRDHLLRAIANSEIFVVEDATAKGTTGNSTTKGDGAPLLAWLWLITVDAAMHVEQMPVDPDHQGRGLGTALMNLAREEAARRGFTSVTLTTFVEVPWNGPWYQRLGFRYLDDDHLGSELRAIREFERLQGFDVSPRSAMILTMDDQVNAQVNTM